MKRESMDNSNNVPQPVEPPMPGQAPQDGYQMPPKKKLSKGALWGIIGGSIAVVLAVVGVVLAFVFLGGPSKEDYNKAGQKLSDAARSYNKITAAESRLNVYISTDSSRQSAVNEIKQSHSDVNSAIDELGKMKAVTNDKDVKEKFDALIAKRDKFNSLINFEVKVVEEFYPVIGKMRSLGSSASPSDIEAIIKDIEGVSLDHEPTKEFKNEMLEFLRTAKAYKEAQAGGKPDTSATMRFYQASTKYQRAALKWQSDLRKYIEESQIKNEINALKDTLQSKYNNK